jgi:hypothetical protein
MSGFQLWETILFIDPTEKAVKLLHASAQMRSPTSAKAQGLSVAISTRTLQARLAAHAHEQALQA